MSHITLSRFMLEAQYRENTPPPELSLLIETIAYACNNISHLLNQGALAGVLGEGGSNNSQGDTQKKLDIIANDIIIEANEWAGTLAAMASEEMEFPYPIARSYPHGKYLLLFDPLDGSSNIDVNVSVGTIFSILCSPQHSAPARENDFLQPGTCQVAAGYAIYGPQTMLVLTWGNGVYGFTLDRKTGSWLLSHPEIRVPKHTSEFAINTSNCRHWEKPVKRYIDELLQGATGVRGRNFNMRWIASMVAEVHRLLMRGGIFMYPRDARCPDKPGKLRLMYEANPMAFIIEQAGGMATNGYQPIMDIVPSALHERVAVFLGSQEEVTVVTGYHRPTAL